MQANTIVFGEPPPEQDASRRQSIIPDQNSAPIQNESDALYRETLLYMRIQLRGDRPFFDSIKVMNTVIKNILIKRGGF